MDKTKREAMNKTSIAIIFLLVVITSVTQACGSNNNETLGEWLGPGTPKPTYQYTPTNNSEIVFAGKVVNPSDGEWTNNRLVLVFLKSKEIARVTTSTMEYTAKIYNVFIDPNIPPATIDVNACIEDRSACGVDLNTSRLDGNLGIVDGLFVLHIPNTYELNLENIGLPKNEAPFVQISEGDGQDRLGVWIDSLNEGDSREFYIPTKNIKYTIMVLAGDVSQLPAEVQKPGSVALLEGNRLVAVDPNIPASTPQPSPSDTRFDQVVEKNNEFSPIIFPINNCGGTAEVKQEVTQTYIHEIVDESIWKLGVEIPVLDWLKIVAEIERRYGISDKQITTYSTMLTVPAGQNIQYTVIRKQTWESGRAIVVSNGVEISAPYTILKSETFEVENSEQKPCP